MVRDQLYFLLKQYPEEADGLKSCHMNKVASTLVCCGVQGYLLFRDFHSKLTISLLIPSFLKN